MDNIDNQILSYQEDAIVSLQQRIAELETAIREYRSIKSTIDDYMVKNYAIDWRWQLLQEKQAKLFSMVGE